jgi:NADH-quinone oxidoreductase subunit G
MATLYIDNKPYEVSSGKNLLEACLQLGFDLPYFCWHPAIGSVGACRQCAIKIFRDENDTKGKLIMSCMEPVTDNQRVSIVDVEAREFRDHVIEWLMTNHPHDCAVCDEGGSCHLQDMTVMTGHAYRNFKFQKRTYQNQYLGPFINHEMNRCIQCYRCVRFYKDYAGGKDLDAYASRNKVYFGRQEDGVLENEFSGNLAEVCPTGVFTDKTLKQHYTRKWDLTMAPSICQHCSLGCNIIAGERYGTLRMIGNRYNREVNGYFICDRGRFGYEYVNSDSRINMPLLQNGVSEAIHIDSLFKKLALLKNKNIIGIGSPRASLESNYALKKLVGENNFYQGVGKDEWSLNQLALNILINSSAHRFSLKEVEQSDAVFVIGEDLTNTAPMLALAVRQAVRQQPMKQVIQTNIPLWNDAAARELIQEEKGPLFISSPVATKLDELATKKHCASPDDVARLAFAVANQLDITSPIPQDLTMEEATLAKFIAEALSQAERPVIIAGTSLKSKSILQATSNLAQALHRKNQRTGMAFAFSECNTLGLTMLGGKSLTEAIQKSDNVDAAIILENDLYRYENTKAVDNFLDKIESVVVIDHTKNRTTEKASVLIPTGTFAEADGTLVNNEGRAQRFFQVYEPGNGIRESWRWIIQISEVIKGNPLPWKNQNDVIKALAKEVTAFHGVDRSSPPNDRFINGQRIPRQPHRYSGRTAMHANISVSEPKPAEDPDSPLSYTMEGLRSQPPSSMIPFFWSPGWNSVQSVNKYQKEIGGTLYDGDSGFMLIQSANTSMPYYDEIPNAFKPETTKLLFIPLYHIFGSEELSTRSPGVLERTPKPYVAINETTADRLQKKSGDTALIQIDKNETEAIVKIDFSIPNGVVGFPVGLPELNFYALPDWGIIK